MAVGITAIERGLGHLDLAGRASDERPLDIVELKRLDCLELAFTPTDNALFPLLPQGTSPQSSSPLGELMAALTECLHGEMTPRLALQEGRNPRDFHPGSGAN